ncbi:Prephenate dehydrogenase [Syntrophomonas zehnderi OL-4]|uniref:Prephenate dehydrogenase n=1 Tax=Syntrophomonas zehnderi OL-4 TaxID=690567 RepID=A0A0E4GCW6_9FIRM|nr:prephenate dehydrogenase [Syntrophomonas zehnderi]CFY08819.1 Prephenate dehydrogenase [Syntrophomonas zehnderi OL-4]
MKIKKVGIIGLGVIGASLGMALRNSSSVIQVAGRDLTEKTALQALEVGAIDEHLDARLLGECDLVVIATPLNTIPQVAAEIKDSLKPGALVSDVGSVKGWVMQVLQQELPAEVHIVGGHPMAGSEKSGLSAADKFLFQNAAYVLTPQPDTPQDILAGLIELLKTIGARIAIMDAQEHDQAVAQVSHLPHLISAALVNNLQNNPEALALAGGGLRDTTRIAASDPELWENILMLNSNAVTQEIKNMQELLQNYLKALEAGDKDKIRRCLATARDLKKNLPSIRPCLEDSCDIIAIIPDQPGVIGNLGSLLGKEQINIQNLQLLGVRDEDEGTIRITVKRESAPTACQLLKANGFKAWLREL